MVCLTKYDHMVVDNRAAGLAGIKPGLRTPAASYYMPQATFLQGLVCYLLLVYRAEQLNENATHS
jgi:hypothetical protein